jgi:type I restriction enzyme S subunit
MGSEWKNVSIEEISAPRKGSIAIGPFGSKMKSDCYVETGIPVIRGTNISNTKRLDGNFVYVTSELAKSLGNANVYPDDLVFPHRGSIGLVAIITGEGIQHYVLSSSLMKLTVDKNVALSEFVFYFFRSKIGIHELLQYSSTVGTPGIGQPLTSLRSIRINLPPLPEQKAIAHILGSLDDKIELNRRMNETLEQMAQALFQSWFVDFDPVIDKALAAGNEIPEPLQARAERRQALGDKRKPLPKEISELFPDVFVETEEMGWIPAGWGVVTLGDISSKISKGTTPRKRDVEGLNETIPFVKVRNISDMGEILLQSLEKIPEEIHNSSLKRSQLEVNDILFSIAGTIGRVSIVPPELPEANCNQAVAFIRLRNKGLMMEMVHQWIRSEVIQNFINAKIVQAVQANISLGTLNNLKLTNVSDDILIQWKNQIYPIYLKLQKLQTESQNLTALRDTLLPKLISGELRVGEEMS